MKKLEYIVQPCHTAGIKNYHKNIPSAAKLERAAAVQGKASTFIPGSDLVELAYA